MVVNDEPLGRNMDEVVRILKAFSSSKRMARPLAGWTPEKEAFTPGNPDNVAAYLAANAKEL